MSKLCACSDPRNSIYAKFNPIKKDLSDLSNTPCDDLLYEGQYIYIYIYIYIYVYIYVYMFIKL